MVYTVGSKCSKNICKRTSTYRQKCGHVFLEHSVGLYTTSDYDSSRYCRSWQQIYFFILITIFYVIFIINSAVNKYVIVRHAQRPAHCAVIGDDTVRRCKKNWHVNSLVAVESQSKSNRSCEQRFKGRIKHCTPSSLGLYVSPSVRLPRLGFKLRLKEP